MHDDNDGDDDDNDDDDDDDYDTEADRIAISKTCVNGHSKINKTKIFMTNGSLMQVKSTSDCSHRSMLQYF